MTDIEKHFKRFLIQGLSLIAAITGIAVAVMYVAAVDGMLVPIIVGAVFALIVESADAIIWRKVATNAPDSLPTFFMAVSGVRMLLALAVMFVYYLAAGKGTMITFFLVFMVYYIILLLHHTLFFAKDRTPAK